MCAGTESGDLLLMKAANLLWDGLLRLRLDLALS